MTAFARLLTTLVRGRHAAASSFVALATVACGVVSTQALAQTQPKQAKPAKLASNATLDRCSWDRPGKNPYMGELPSAVDRFADIPADVRSKLKSRIAAQQYDDMVVIKRDAITSSEGKFVYAAQIRDMHFGDKGRVCKTVTRTKWKAATTERGLTYCEGAHCVLVPTVCRNVSRVERKPSNVAAAPANKVTPVVVPDAPVAAPAGGPMAAAKPDGAAPAPAMPLAPGGGAPAFSDVAAGPVFAFPAGPTGTSSVAVVAPPVGGPITGVTPGTGGTTTPSNPGTGGTTVVPPPPPTGGVTDPGTVGGVAVVTPVPEPSTWALMLGGLLLVAWRVRSQRRAAALAKVPVHREVQRR